MNYTDIFFVLIKFPMYKVALIADIEKAFLFVRRTEILRLLLVDDPNLGHPKI